MKLNRHLVFLSILFLSCAHQMRVESTPPDAQVYAVGKDGKRGKLLGRTPFEINGLSASISAIEVEQLGHVPERVIIPQGVPSSIEIDIELRPLTEAWAKAQPPSVFGKSLDTAIGEHVELQEQLLSLSDEEAEKAIKAASAKYASMPTFHYIVGQYHLYRGRYSEAADLFRKALELDPADARARRMLVLVDAKMVSSSQSERARAMSVLQTAVRDLAEANKGRLTNISGVTAPGSARGFEMLLPTDNLFKKGTSKPTREAVILAQKLVDEFRKIRFPIRILVEGHTDSSLTGEEGVVSSGGAPILSLMEISSARASSFLELLQSEGGQFAQIAIAGYGNTKPAAAEGAKGAAKGAANAANQSANRRLVVRVVYETNDPSTNNLDDFFPAEPAAKPKPAPQKPAPAGGGKSDKKSSTQPDAPKAEGTPAPLPGAVPPPRAPRVTLPSVDGEN
jgi:outer membrane protein OmpA-like peptidoglycan-associated protein